jgi:hypothetical protein
VRHIKWHELEAPVRLAIEDRMGPVRGSYCQHGLNSQFAVILDTDTGTVFVKGLPLDHPPGAVW